VKIEAKNLVKTYVQGDGTVTALSDVSLTIQKGDFIAITGRSGSGKSTLLNVMAGLTIPTSGSVIFDERDIFTLSDAELSYLRNAQIGCVPQVSSVLSELTVLDNVRLPFHLAKREGDSAKEAMRLLALMDIEKLAKRKPARLSGGQLKRVAIARALINKPALLLVDEPTGDLDEATTNDIMNIFSKVTSEGTAILMVTHDLDTTAYAAKCYEMAHGVLSASYSSFDIGTEN